MKTEIQIFNNELFGQIRVTTNENNEPIFAGIDLAKALGYKNPAEAIATNCKSSDIEIVYSPHSNGVGGTNIQFVSESNMYRLIMRSQLPDVEKFQDWVVEDVLVNIRKHGGYMTPQKIEEVLLNPDTLIKLATNLKEEQEKRIEAEKQKQVLEQQNEIQKLELVKSAPKVQYFDEVLQSKNGHIISVIAKELGMSATTLNRKLHQMGIQYKTSEAWLLYSKYEGKGYTVTETYPVKNSNGEPTTRIHTLWTEKGRKFIHELLGHKLTNSQTKQTSFINL